jgi:hypothetical protein
MDLALIVADPGSADAMNDRRPNSPVLSDALIKIIDLGLLAAERKAASADLLIRAGDIAAQA